MANISTDAVTKASNAMDAYCAIQHALIAAIQDGFIDRSETSEQIINLCGKEMDRMLTAFDEETQKVIKAAMKNQNPR